MGARMAQSAREIPQFSVAMEVDATRLLQVCLLYTSDAADERSSVDLGGRRIIKTQHQGNRRVGY